MSLVKLNAQVAEAKIDTNSILLGDQINLKLKFQIPKEFNYTFPFFNDTIAKSIEIIETGKIDTLIQGNDLVLTQNYIITSFDSGFHVIKPFIFNYFSDGDTVSQIAETEPLLLEVKKVAIDETLDIKDIKDIMNAPLTFAEIWPYLLGVVILALVVYLIIYYLRKRKKQQPLFKTKAVPIAPHIEALKALEELKLKKLWQTNLIKQYYTELTDIIRIYLEKTTAVNAMEMTSDDIILALHETDTEKELISDLSKVFRLSDLVKFAKFMPLASEHDYCFKKCESYVMLTSKKSEEAYKKLLLESEQKEIISEEIEPEKDIKPEIDENKN